MTHLLSFSVCSKLYNAGFDEHMVQLKSGNRSLDAVRLYEVPDIKKSHSKINETQMFRDLFEFVQSKTYSEAICESIGSIMNMATSGGRYLNPQNFNKEIFLRYNLPPLHTLTGFIEDILQDELANKKEFIRKADSDPRQARKLNFKSMSSSIGNFRSSERDKFNGLFLN